MRKFHHNVFRICTCVFCAITVFACDSHPTPQMLTSLDSQTVATSAAKRRVQELQIDRDALKQELQGEETQQVQLQNEISRLEGANQ